MLKSSKTVKTIALLFVLAALICNNRSTLPITVRFNNVPLNYWYSGTLPILFASTVIFLGVVWKNLIVKILTITVGGLLLVVALLLGLLEAADMSASVNGSDPIHQLETELAVGRARYRLYTNYTGGMFYPPFADLYKEWDTTVGIRFVRRVWIDTYNCCYLSLRVVNERTIEVFDKSNGKIVGTVME
jgi:hypothetical protein